MTTNTIQFGFQNWNSDYDWWMPNTVPADFVIDGVKQLPATHSVQWFDSGIWQDWTKRNTAFDYAVIKSDFLYNHAGSVVYTHLSKLADLKYIFPVLIRDTQYFLHHRDLGFDSVDPQVFEDVRAGRCRIVLLFPLEGMSGDQHFEYDFDILNSWCIKHNLTRQQVYYVHGNHRGVELSAGMNFTYIPIDTFICWVPRISDHIAAYEPKDSNNLFLNYNRRPRLHRTVMMCELIHNGLLDRGLVSYHGDNVKDTVEKVSNLNRLDLLSAAQQLDSLLPIEIDMNLGENNPAENIVEDHYRRTFLSVVPETLYSNNVLFFSEKIWKTIAVGHPFMLIGSPGMLNKLREQGYRTYSAWWDEGYDQIQNIDDRIRHIVRELSRLSELSQEQLINIRADMQSTIEHNQQLFNSRHKESCVHKEHQLYKIVEDIWNSF